MQSEPTTGPKHDVPREVMLLAEALKERHGDVTVAFESSGLHLYMASPEGLERDGTIELEKRHLAVNADKYLRRGKYASLPRTINTDRAAQCMKYGTGYLVTRLLNWPKLADRGITVSVAKVRVNSASACLVDDGRGNLIPPSPGRCTLITELPQDHVAVQYLLSRKYDLPTLVRQFRCSYCEEELPENSEAGIGYRRLPAGFNDTPQGRIVFFGDIGGVQNIWQARVIDCVQDGIKFYWHPYKFAWHPCEQWDEAKAKFVPLPELASSMFKWDISKYRTARGSSRTESLMGYDAAVTWNATAGLRKPTAIVAEGPLDCGRIGPPAMAMLGKHMSGAQALLLSRRFRRVIYVRDNDAAGLKAEASVERACGTMIDLVCVSPPTGKDLGAMALEAAWGLIGPVLFG